MIFGPRCWRCRRRLPAEHTTVIVDARTVVCLCDGCACLYTSGRTTIFGVSCPDAVGAFLDWHYPEGA